MSLDAARDKEEVPDCSFVDVDVEVSIKEETSESDSSESQDDSDGLTTGGGRDSPVMELRARANYEQYTALVEFMERTGDLAQGQAKMSSRSYSEPQRAALWQELEGALNAVAGGVYKPLDKWKKVWADWKTKTKRKMHLIRKHEAAGSRAAGNRPALTALERRVLAVMGSAAAHERPRHAHKPRAPSSEPSSPEPEPREPPEQPEQPPPAQPRDASDTEHADEGAPDGEKEPRQRASYQQYRALLEYMERHGDLFRAPLPLQERAPIDQLWSDLATTLNSIDDGGGGGVTKPVLKWKKMWADWKTKTKAKAVKRRPLSAHERRVLAVVAAKGAPVATATGTVTVGRGHKQPYRDFSQTQFVKAELQPQEDMEFEDAFPFMEWDGGTSAQESPPAGDVKPEPSRAPPRRVLRARWRPPTHAHAHAPADRAAAAEFVALERQRLRLDEERERWLHERELRRLQLEEDRERHAHARDTERLRLEEEHVAVLRRVADVGEALLAFLTNGGTGRPAHS